MTVTLNLPPDIEESFLAQARALGISVDDFVLNLLVRVPTGPPESETADQWIRRFREWAESHPIDTPLLSDEAISRESIYSDRGW
jgi:hypothetical protein